MGIFLSLMILTVTSYTMAFPQNPGTYAYFERISNMPYVSTPGPHPETFWQKGGDCDDRAIVFADYLKSKGAKNVQICCAFEIENGSSVKVGHAFVVWNGRVYSPTHTKNYRFYNSNIPAYKNFLKKTYGLNMWYNNAIDLTEVTDVEKGTSF